MGKDGDALFYNVFVTQSEQDSNQGHPTWEAGVL